MAADLFQSGPYIRLPVSLTADMRSPGGGLFPMTLQNTPLKRIYFLFSILIFCNFCSKFADTIPLGSVAKSLRTSYLCIIASAITLWKCFAWSMSRNLENFIVQDLMTLSAVF